MKSGFVGSRVGYALLKRMGRHAMAPDYQSATSYEGISKLEALFSPGVWDEIKDKTVIDYGCGYGQEAVEMAQRGARRVIGIDTWEKALGKANENARKAGVTSLCEFTGTEQASQEGLHPYGGHLFSIFPWSHLIFTEIAQIRWRSDFKSEGATRFHEVDGGLNQMTIRQFRKLIGASDFTIEKLEPIPIRKLRWLSNALTREFTTSVVRCTLIPE